MQKRNLKDIQLYIDLIQLQKIEDYYLIGKQDIII